MKITYSSPNGEYSEPDITARPIEIIDESDLILRAAPTGGGGIPRPYVNEEQNSRITAALSLGEWSELWVADLRPRFTPRFVLQDGDRILVQAGVWQLFDLHGAPLASRKAGGSPVVLDVENSLFYLTDSDGYLVGWSFDGREIFTTLPMSGDEYTRPFIGRYGHRMLVVGNERQIGPTEYHKASNSVIELINLGDPMDISDTGLLLSATSDGALIVPTTRLMAVVGGDTLVFVVPDTVYVTGLDLKIKAAFGGKFEPVTMSMDEARRIYLVVLTEGGYFLWLITTDGKRLYSVELPEDVKNILTPPIIGYDHRVYLLTAGRLMAVSPEGILLWECKPKRQFAGAVVTSDDQLLIAAGSDLGVFDAEGSYHLLHKFEGEILNTPPVLTADGKLLVATEERLYCLTSK